MRKKIRALALLAIICSMIPVTGFAQVRAIYDQGGNALLRQLQRLQTTASVLHTGAHPDDEDSALVAYHARRQHARTAYLSLTRGSGGQNIIGTEQSDLLGIIRTEELLQARRLDGAEQLFTSANDFGFSKNLTEASRMWNEEAVLGDMVRAIRRFRPAVVVSRWNGTPADGHGHHQYAGYLTPLAVLAAADVTLYAEHFTDGLTPWRVDKFYVMQRLVPGASESPSLVVNTGELDPVTGRSYFEIGMQGRSQQKTQQMGSLELRGNQFSGLQLIESRVDTPATESGIFDGIDTSISGIASLEAESDPQFVSVLADLETSVAAALTRYEPLNPDGIIGTLVDCLGLARAARSNATSLDAQRLLAEKTAEIESAIVLAAGISIDALADTETPVPGSTLQIAARIYGIDRSDVDVVDVKLHAPATWDTSVSDANALSNEANYRRRDRADAEYYFATTVPANAKSTQPYWLELPRERFTYDWSQAGDAQNQPFQGPLLVAKVTLDVAGEQILIEKEVEYRFVDRVRGEIRRQIDVVPAVSVEAATDLLIVPTSLAEHRYELLLAVRNNSRSEVSGTAGFTVPADWTIEPAAADFSLAASPASTTLAFNVTLPENVMAGEYLLKGAATIDGATYQQTMREITYPHIQTHRSYNPSSTEFKIIDVSVAPVSVGYVMGSGDKVPEAMRRLGLEVTLLDDEALTTGDLSRFETIVVGIRASQTRPAFVANNQRLLDFAAQGGTVIVQYQQPDFIAKDLAPFPASMDGNVRVVDETAPIVILQPEHPAFNYPNQIGNADFDGWVQERNNYNFTSFDRSRYVALTESHDDGEPESEGGMLYAEIGDGHYIYTAYSWFRQLPNGVPGAYRLFANLLSLPAAPQ